jgi:hypothetical protein
VLRSVSRFAHTLTILHREVSTACFQDTPVSLLLVVAPLRFVLVSAAQVVAAYSHSPLSWSCMFAGGSSRCRISPSQSSGL